MTSTAGFASQVDQGAKLAAHNGGSSGTAPTISFDPAAPTDRTTITVRFAGTPPSGGTVHAVMQTGMTMRTAAVALRPAADPHTLSGVLHFSMSGPWTVVVQYGKTRISRPIIVGEGQ
ncbi:MAG: hypothetical protein ACYDGM_00725 [Vulcanimicrobiaceae bacterium]